MSRHTLAEAQAHLPELIARAAAGEEVVIAPETGLAVMLRAVLDSPPWRGPVDPAKLAWLESLAERPARPCLEHPGEAVSRMRDQDVW